MGSLSFSGRYEGIFLRFENIAGRSAFVANKEGEGKYTFHTHPPLDSCEMDDFGVPNTSCGHNEVVSDWRVVKEGKITSEHLWCDCDVSEAQGKARRIGFPVGGTNMT
jgi:hypothetical protein